MGPWPGGLDVDPDLALSASEPGGGVQETERSIFGSALGSSSSTSRSWVQASRSTASITTVIQAALIEKSRLGKWSRPVSLPQRKSLCGSAP